MNDANWNLRIEVRNPAIDWVLLTPGHNGISNAAICKTSEKKKAITLISGEETRDCTRLRLLTKKACQ